MKNELKTRPCLKPMFETISNTDANFLNMHIDKATKTRRDKQLHLIRHTFYETNYKPKLFTANVECIGTGKDFRITPYIYYACRVINYVCTLLF